MTFLICPVASDSTRSKPFTIHGGQGLFCIRTFAERNKSITTGATSLHVPHNTSFGDTPKGRESLEKDFVVDFIAKVPDKDMKVVGGIFFVVAV